MPLAVLPPFLSNKMRVLVEEPISDRFTGHAYTVLMPRMDQCDVEGRGTCTLLNVRTKLRKNDENVAVQGKKF